MNQVIDAFSPARRPFAGAAELVPRLRHDVLFGQVVTAADAAVLAACFFGAYALRDHLSWYGSLLPLREHLWVLAVAIGLWVALARGAGLTNSHSYFAIRPLLVATLKVHVIGALLVLSGLYLMRAVDVSRLFMQTFLAVGAVALVAERLAIRFVLVGLERRAAADKRRVLVVGSNDVAGRVRYLLASRPHWGATVAGVVSYGMPSGLEVTRVEQPGSPGELSLLLDTIVFDDVIVSGDDTDPGTARRLAENCFERGLTFHTLVEVPTAPRARYRTETLDEGLCLMSVETAPQDTLPLLFKRLIDLVGATVGLIVCGAALVILAPVIRLGSRGPVFFRQIRIGRNGRPFTLYKFRTMRPDAEAQKAALAAANDMRGFLFKIKDDPRITAVGRWLRRAYIDELPQFWNVLRGDMSLVGTRPPTPDEVARYAPHHRRRLSMRPGITGLWQAQGNGQVTDFEDVVRLDCAYIDQWSLPLDLAIILRTCATVVRCGGH